MPESLFSVEPGSLSPAATVELLGARAAERLIVSFPPSWQAGLALSQIALAAGGAITAAAASGPLAIGVAVVQAFKSLNSAVNDWAAQLKADVAADWTDKLNTLGSSLAQSANGRCLALYQPADTLTLKRAQAFTGDGAKLEALISQFRAGYVHGVKRPFRSDYIAAVVPVLTFTGRPLGLYIRESIYADAPESGIGPLSAENGWEGDNTWLPLGLGKWDAQIAGFAWATTAAELANAHGCPPVRMRILVAPGLAPAWGPYGNLLPVPETLAAYSSALLGAPPPDLDRVASAVAYANKWGLNPQSTPILDLLWAREDLARRGKGGHSPRGDAWAGPFWQLVGLPDPASIGKQDSTRGGGATRGSGSTEEKRQGRLPTSAHVLSRYVRPFFRQVGEVALMGMVAVAAGYVASRRRDHEDS